MPAERRVFESDVCTHGIRVEVRSSYVRERSDPDQGQWFFAYSVRISNEGQAPVQLLSRHWVITDADGKVSEVKGPGVVGEQPLLDPGESFEYTSACPLETPYGTMHGTYQMETDGGERFDAAIAPFLLGEPKGVH
jgi:ApaG protein